MRHYDSRLPHPLILLLAAVVLAAVLTWILPAGSFDRRDDPATGRRVVVAGTYHPVEPRAGRTVRRGRVRAARVRCRRGRHRRRAVRRRRVGRRRSRSARWPALVAVLVARFRRRGLSAIPVICMFFAIDGRAREHAGGDHPAGAGAAGARGAGSASMRWSVVAMSAGAAIVGSAFGPTNPFQAGIALKLAQLPPFAAERLRAGDVRRRDWPCGSLGRLAMPREIVTGVGRGSRLHPRPKLRRCHETRADPASRLRRWRLYVYGALRLGWGFNELSGGFLIAGIVAGSPAAWG